MSNPRTLLVLLAAALLCCSACTDELARTAGESSPQRSAAQPLVEQTAPAAPLYQPPRDPAFDPEAEAALKRGTIPLPSPSGEGAGVGVIVEVDEAAAAAWPTVPASALPEEARETLAAAPLPVLVPDPAALAGGLADSRATRGPWWYALSTRTTDGLSLEMTGRREAVVNEAMARVDLTPLLVEGRFLVSRSHGIVTVSWREFGEVAYSLDVECAQQPLEDVRCAEDAFALELARGVLRVDEQGGQP